MRNDGVPSTAGDAGVVGVGASAAPGLGRLLPLFGAAFFKAGVAACGVLEAWTWRAAAMASSPARSSSVSPFRDSAERGVVGSGCMCATVAAGAYRRRGWKSLEMDTQGLLMLILHFQGFIDTCSHPESSPHGFHISPQPLALHRTGASSIHRPCSL